MSGNIPFLSALAAVGWLALSPPAAAQEGLKMGVAGADLARAKCLLCHEAGHITRLRQNRAAWEDTVDLMIRRGAPISPEERRIILDYLVTQYGEAGDSPSK